MYYVVNRQGEYLIRDQVPCTWSAEREGAASWSLFDAATKAIKRLWPSTHRAVGARVVWEA